MSEKGGDVPSKLISFLGTGKYSETVYGFGDRRAPRTRWVALALQELLDPSPAETVVLATDEAWAQNGAALCAAFEESEKDPPRHVRIPLGKNGAELWEQFDIIKQELRRAGPRVVVDITHGFRHQPFFAAGVITFVRLVDPQPPEVRVVYGAFDLVRTFKLDHAPILELTAFVDLLEWAHDLALFLKTGLVGRLPQRFAAAAQGGSGSEVDQRLRDLIDRIVEFSRDLQTIRTGALLLGTPERPSSAKRLRDAIEAVREDLPNHMPALADVLGRIEKEMVDALVFDRDHLSGQEGKRVLADLADLYVRLDRYIEAATTLREGLISIFSPPEAARPGLEGYDERAREEWKGKVIELNQQIYERFAQVRNDLDHAGYRKNPGSPECLISKVKGISSEFRSLKIEEAPKKESNEGVQRNGER